MPQVPQTTESNTRRTHSVLFVGLLVALLAALCGWNWLNKAQSGVPPTARFPATVAKDPTIAVSLSMNRGDGPSAALLLTHHPGMTVFDAMACAAQLNPDWHFQSEGSGSKAFLVELGGLVNEEAAQRGEARFWQYNVNGERAAVSYGSYLLAPGDRVLWKFAPYE